ncbi:MAG: complex I NDUFA9 subunit family protein [Rickettsiales bacterium]
MQKARIVTLIGGTGFIGKYVVKHLAAEGYVIRVVSRDPEGALSLKTSGDVGQIVLQYGDLAKPKTLEGLLDGSFAVINLVGILFERGRQNFSALHAQGAEKLAKMCKDAGVQRFVHISSLGVDKATSSKYAKTKFFGEKATLAAFPEATILRPGVVFGPEDNFFNQFANILRIAPAFPLFGGGKTRFQPVYVGDVAEAVLQVLENQNTQGKIYELGGPDIVTFKEILQFTADTIRRSPCFFNLPFTLASLGATFAEFIPTPPLTRDQVRLLHYDNIVNDTMLSFADLGIQPESFRLTVPSYLQRFVLNQPQTA